MTAVSDAADFEARLKKVRLVVLDVDGVLTDGRIVYGDYGDELKFFDVTDGMGIELLREAGIPTVIVSARKSKTNERRAKELRVARIFQNVPDKLKAFTKALRQFGVSADETLCAGDDLGDVPLLKRAGLAVAVPNAVPDVKAAAHYVTSRPGGHGAVREICDLVLKAQGHWPRVTQKFFR